MVHRVMVVEDDPKYRELLSLLLRARSYQVIAVGDYETAYKTFTSDKIDCCLIDYCLPGKNGVELSTLIREQDMKIGIILMTAQDRDRVNAEAEGLCIWSILPKPVEYKTLLQSVEDACELTNMAPEAESRLITAFSVETQNMKRVTKDLLDETGEHGILRKKNA